MHNKDTIFLVQALVGVSIGFVVILAIFLVLKYSPHSLINTLTQNPFSSSQTTLPKAILTKQTCSFIKDNPGYAKYSILTNNGIENAVIGTITQINYDNITHEAVITIKSSNNQQEHTFAIPQSNNFIFDNSSHKVLSIVDFTLNQNITLSFSCSPSSSSLTITQIVIN